MTIEFIKDRSIDLDEKHSDVLSSLIEDGFERYESHITTIEALVSNENATSEGTSDMRCLLEIRINGKKPIAVSSGADTIEEAVLAAIDKLTATLDSIIEHRQNHSNIVCVK